MKFEFIDNNARIDRRTRKRIRSLVATGKNAGRSIERPSKIKALNEQSKHTMILSSIKSTKLGDTESHPRAEIVSEIPEIERQIGDMLCLLPICEAWSPTSKNLAKQAMCFFTESRQAPELKPALRVGTSLSSTWMQAMFENEAFLHCAIALTIKATRSRHVNQDNSREAIHHLCRTFGLVNKQLSENKIIPSSTIATVMMMAQYERHDSQHYQGLVHLNGLRRLINLRGGIHEIKKDWPILMQKAFRIDLDYALYMGTTTMFQIDQLISGGLLISKFDTSNLGYDGFISIRLKEVFSGISPDLYKLLLDMTALSRQLNDAGAEIAPKLEIERLNCAIILFGYRAIRISSLVKSYQLSGLEREVHLGVVMFVTTFMNKLDRTQPEMPLIAELLRSLVDYESEGNQMVLMWLLFLGEASVLKYYDRDWLVPIVRRVAQGLGIATWEDVLRMLLNFPWVNAIYNKAGQALWDKVCRADELAFTMRSEVPRRVFSRAATP